MATQQAQLESAEEAKNKMLDGCVPAPIRSPDRNVKRSKEEKKALKKQYRVDANQFGKVLNCLLQVNDALNALQTALDKRKGHPILFPMYGPDGQQLRDTDQFGNPTQSFLYYEFTRRHLTQGRKKFRKAFKQLKDYHRHANTQSRELVPESFSGVFGPVYLEDALLNFVSRGNFGNLTDGVTPLNRSLSMIQTRFAQRNTVVTLFYIYVSQYVNNLKVVGQGNMFVPDQHMINSFAGQIPAKYKLDLQAGKRSVTKCGVDKGLKYPKATWALNEPQVNTFEVLARAYPPGQIPDLKRANAQGICLPKVDDNGREYTKDIGFNRQQPFLYYFQNLASHNYTGFREAQETGRNDILGGLSANATNQPALAELKAAMLADTVLVKSIAEANGLRQEEANRALPKQKKVKRAAA